MIKVLRRPVEFTLASVIGVDHGLPIVLAVFVGHEQGRVDHVARGAAPRGPPDRASGKQVEHHAAVEFAVSRRVLGDVGEP
jgi:hypothetical protein